MDGLWLIQPTELYNILNQKTSYPCLSDPVYLLLLDTRSKLDFEESHILMAKRAPVAGEEEYLIPYDADLECKTHVVVYDGNTDSVKNGDSPAVKCAWTMWENGSRNPVAILKGGYEEFSALYPFLRTQKVIYMPRELDELATFPIEVLPGFLYLGDWNQGNRAVMQKDLKVVGHIACCMEQDTFFKKDDEGLLHIAIEDNNDADIYSHFKTACDFIEKHREGTPGGSVVVYSRLGISRSATIVVAYLMFRQSTTLKAAYNHVLSCSASIRPNRAFIAQLSLWEREQELHGASLTDVTDPHY